MAYCQHIQKSMKKFSATFPMLKFSRQTPTLRWFFSRDSQEGLNFRLFRHFRHIGVVGGVQKQIGIKFQWVTMISSKNGGCGTSQGPTIIFSEKKSVDLNPVTLSHKVNYISSFPTVFWWKYYLKVQHISPDRSKTGK